MWFELNKSCKHQNGLECDKVPCVSFGCPSDCKYFELKSLNLDERNYFYLMNKDVLLLSFEVSGEGILEKIKIKEKFNELPFWINNPVKFLSNRRVPKKRENIKELLKLSGCDTLLGYFDITHALSLTDTFWVKRIDSDLTWNEVSLYTHQFNEVIAKIAFDGGLYGYNLATTSPEYGTDGTFAKCWVREDGQIRLLKRGSSGARNAGLEPYSEFYISQIAEALQLDSVTYGLRSHNGRMCSICDIFTSEKHGFVPYALVDHEGSSTMISVLEYFEALGLEKEVRDMFVFDAVVFNEDRHKGNFGFIVDNDSFKIEGMAPLFDHNIALLCYAEQEDFENLSQYLSMKGPRIGDDFVSDAKVLLTSDMRKKLIRLRGFQFKNHPKYNLPDWRLKALNKAVNRQIDLILA